jgi:antitoxin VapB
MVENVSMNIKNPEAQRLAEALVAITGESLTAAIIQALRERLERVQRERGGGLSQRLLAIGSDCAARLKEPFRSANHGELLYDDRGLPK